MTTLTFDTLDAARSLRSAGADERTAVAIVAVVQRTTLLPSIDHLATKDQLEASRLASKDQLENVEKRMVGAIGDFRTLMFAMFSINIASVLGMGAVLYTLLRR